MEDLGKKGDEPVFVRFREGGGGVAVKVEDAEESAEIDAEWSVANAELPE